METLCRLSTWHNLHCVCDFGLALVISKGVATLQLARVRIVGQGTFPGESPLML